MIVSLRKPTNAINNSTQQLNPIIMTSSCSATLSAHQRRVLRLLLAKESEIVEQYNQTIARFSRMLNELTCINHHRDSDARALKCEEFIRSHASIACDTTICDMVPDATQTAMTCDCTCIQAACFRILYKWIPLLDTLRMKLLKIKSTCATATNKHVPKNGVDTCAEIEQMVRKILKPTSP